MKTNEEDITHARRGITLAVAHRQKKSGNRGCLFPDSEEEVFFEKVKSAILFTSLLLIV